MLRNLILNEIDQTAKTQNFINIATVVTVDIPNRVIECQVPVFTDKYVKIPMEGLGLGTNAGIMKVPKVGDVVLIIQFQQRWYLLGSLFDVINNTTPIILLPTTTEGETIFKNDGAVLRHKTDGTILLMNKNGYGISISPTGAIVIRGSSIDTFSTPFTIELDDEYPS